MRRFGGLSLNVLQQFDTSEYIKLLNSGFSQDINTYDVKEGKGKGKGHPRTVHEHPEGE
jgi:hypothetical protein